EQARRPPLPLPRGEVLDDGRIGDLGIRLISYWGSLSMRRRNAVRNAAAWLAAAIIALGAGAVARAEAGPPEEVAPVGGMTEYRPDNGARVLLFPDRSAPKVTVNMTVLVGSRHEGYGEAGMAHLLEHLVFKGTPKNPDIVGQMKARGAQFNGSTSPDR